MTVSDLLPNLLLKQEIPNSHIYVILSDLNHLHELHKQFKIKQLGEIVMDRSWNLDDAQTVVDEFPHKFSAPSKEQLDPLEKGGKAKLIFRFKSNDPEIPQVEQLWVEILLVQHDDKLLGQLEDNPKYIQDLKRGEIIEFEERHIIDTD